MINTKAIVIKQSDYNDHDALVSFYTLEFGKITLLARGLRRPQAKLAGHLDSFNLVDLMIIKGQKHNYLGTALSENSFLKLKKDYYKLFNAGRALSFLNQITLDGQADYQVFLLIKEFLEELDKFSLKKDSQKLNSISLSLLALIFKIRLVKILGYDFNFSSCSLCQKEEVQIWDFSKKEFSCLKCWREQGGGIENSNYLNLSKKLIELKKEIDKKEDYNIANFKISPMALKDLDNFLNLLVENL